MTSAPQFFRALADRTRLRIVNLLARGSLCVCDIQRILEQPQSSVSRHLALLKSAGLIVDRRDGMRTFYALDRLGLARSHAPSSARSAPTSRPKASTARISRN